MKRGIKKAVRKEIVRGELPKRLSSDFYKLTGKIYTGSVAKSAIENWGARRADVDTNFLTHTKIRGGRKHRFEEIEASSGLDRANKPGTYNVNNAVIAVVDESGDKYVAPATSERLVLLKKGGYRKNESMSVPYSSGDDIDSIWMRMKFGKDVDRVHGDSLGKEYRRGVSMKREIKKTKRRSLERVVAVIAIVAFASSFLFFRGITGNVIGVSAGSNWYGIILLFVSLFFSAVWLWLKGKKDNVI